MAFVNSCHCEDNTYLGHFHIGESDHLKYGHFGRMKIPKSEQKIFDHLPLNGLGKSSEAKDVVNIIFACQKGGCHF